MGVRDDCRHYVQRSTTGGELLRRCRVGAANEMPFACPDGCLFFEARLLSTAGWTREGDQPMSNTALGLASLPPPTSKTGPSNKAKTGKSKKSRRKPR
ncbi:MAG TPA: hypothetical protein VEJ84_23310 [Acidimicrobiales bacterium]|nr:hypothetical protein [Acidimicrobiales bacterium]